jgi:hypothetical protein
MLVIIEILRVKNDYHSYRLKKLKCQVLMQSLCIFKIFNADHKLYSYFSKILSLFI